MLAGLYYPNAFNIRIFGNRIEIFYNYYLEIAKQFSWYSCWILVRFVSGFMSGSGSWFVWGFVFTLISGFAIGFVTGRVWFVSGFVSGSCPVGFWFAFESCLDSWFYFLARCVSDFVFSSYLRSRLVRICFGSGSDLGSWRIRIWFIFNYDWFIFRFISGFVDNSYSNFQYLFHTSTRKEYISAKKKVSFTIENLKILNKLLILFDN